MSSDKASTESAVKPETTERVTEKKEKQPLDNKTIRELEASTGEVQSNFVVKEDGKTKDVRFYPDKPTLRIHKDRFIIKEPSRFYDPCAESSKMAIRCMENNDETYKEVCVEYFKAYRECKKEWMKERKKDGYLW